MSPCHEIVHFTFVDGTPFESQRAHLETLGIWARDQPGFVSRACFFDEASGHWTDLVTWQDRGAAEAAMERAGQDAGLAPAMAAIQQDGMRFGHYRRVL